MKIFVDLVILINMKYKKILVTGGAGFVGSHICLKFKERFLETELIAFDNLIRKGSELNVPRLEEAGVRFIKGDVRNRKDLEIEGVDLIIECSAEPSVMAGVNSSPEYLLDTNLGGAVNCFELARKANADIIFLSTSRVYPVKRLNELQYEEIETRFTLKDSQKILGASSKGISEAFPLDGVRTLYGATKLSAELLLAEYIENYGINGVINRCGLISGPWQMGKVDQGVIVYWFAHHLFKKPLAYFGFDGKGKQVRDVLHIDDLLELLFLQIQNIGAFNNQIYNVGGGKENSVSLLELTKLCEDITGNTVKISIQREDRPGDVRIYITDNSTIENKTDWKPKKSIKDTGKDIYAWMLENKQHLENIL